MVKKRVDDRVRALIESGVRKNHRSMFVLVGDHGKDQVENLHKILAKSRVKTNPSVLWCYKKELGFSTHRKKRMNEIKRNKARGLHDPDRDDPFDLFISTTDIRWAYYKETDKIIGQTFGMAVLQDFEALTPNLLARTVETVEGGGLVILLLKTVKSLKQLYTISMDVHTRFRTEAHHEIIPRFNERFILSLGECTGCLVLDDELNVLPISGGAHALATDGSSSGMGLKDGEADLSGYNEAESAPLKELKASLGETPHVGQLVSLAKTMDQAKVLMSFLDAISEKTLRATVALTAARGRGKSAAIGLCLAGAVSFGYSNIFVTAPSPENLKTVFQFVIMGLKALKYTEHLDFEVLQEHQGDVGKCVVRINLFRDHRQTIQYILPTDHAKLAQAELVAIDEAAAIPLPVVKKLLGPYLVFMSSTVNGYEGTGRALSLKLMQQLRTQQGQANMAAAQLAGESVGGARSKKGERRVHEERWKVAAQTAAAGMGGASGLAARMFTELSLNTPIRYGVGDSIERWLNQLLCMDVAANAHRIVTAMPAPKDCDLYVVNRDALFSSHALAEALLQRVWALYTAAHYKNSPNDLQMLSDAPAHRLFVLLGPQTPQPAAAATKATSSNGEVGNGVVLPNVLCVVQVAFEGFISQKSVQSEIQRSSKASGDMIPWTLAQQFNDSEFATLSGARVVRIATHPDVQKMGYGSRALDLLIDYFQSSSSGSRDGPGSLPVGEFGGEGAVGVPTLRSTSSSSSSAGQKGSSASGDSELNLTQDEVKPRAKLPPLLTPVGDRPAETLHWLGVSYGLVPPLLNFWSRKQFKVCYVRQTKNDLTGEHSCIMLRELNRVSDSSRSDPNAPVQGWLGAYVSDYRKRLVSLMSYAFSSLEAALAITLVDPDRELTSSSSSGNAATEDDDKQHNELQSSRGNDTASSSSSLSSSSKTALALSSSNSSTHLVVKSTAGGSGGSSSSFHASPLTASELLSVHLSHHDMKRLEMYSRNMVDHHMIVDTLPTLARLLFLGRLRGVKLTYLQVAILLATGLQHRDVDSIAAELDLPVNQVLAFFNKTIRKIAQHLRELLERQVALEMLPSNREMHRMEKKAAGMGALGETLAEDQRADERAAATAQRQALLLGHKDLAQHALTGVDSGELYSSFHRAMKKQHGGGVPSSISIPVTSAMRLSDGGQGATNEDKSSGGSSSGKKKNKNKKHKGGEHHGGSGSDDHRYDSSNGGGSGKKRKLRDEDN